MTRTVSIHQSNYLPGIRLIEKIAQSDYYIDLDPYAQISKHSWQVRNHIRGMEKPLTVPTEGGSKVMIGSALISPVNWHKKHLRAITQTYSKAPYFAWWRPKLEEIYSGGYLYLTAINDAITTRITEFLGITCKWVWPAVSEIDEIGIVLKQNKRVAPKFHKTIPWKVELPTGKNERLIEMVKRVGGTRYISSAGSADYIDESLWESAGIEHVFQSFDEKPYLAMWPEFDPNLSALDWCMFNTSLPKLEA